jgi:hypothetical protein
MSDTEGVERMKKYRFNRSKDSGHWNVIVDGKMFPPVITRTSDGMCTVSENGVLWPGRYFDRHYAARDILRKEGLWDDQTDNDWMGAKQLLNEYMTRGA